MPVLLQDYINNLLLLTLTIIIISSAFWDRKLFKINPPDNEEYIDVIEK
jgi:hypothetical protein